MNQITTALLAAMIASALSYVGLVITKEQKTSEFRQSWIDSLRQSIANFTAFSTSAYVARAYEDFGTDPEVKRKYRADVCEMNIAAASIRLRLNPKEARSKTLLENVSAMEFLVGPRSGEYQWQKLVDHEAALLKSANAILKAEWKRVQQGEVTFRISKWLFAFAMIIFVLAIAISWSSVAPH